MNAPLVAVSDTVFPNLDLARAALSKIDAKLQLASEATPEAILDVARDADGLLVTYGQITAEIIEELNNCKVIGRFGVGTDNIDLAAAAKANIVVTYAPVYCLDEVSDHSMAMLLALIRKIPYANKLVQGGRWEMRAVTPIGRIRGRTLGLVGLGNISRAMVPKARAFGIDVIALDPYADDEVFAGLDVKRVDLGELLSTSDYITLHAPLTAETHNMFDADAFRQMKTSALLVNTARGPLIDVDALADALEAGEIAGAALDVLPVEPPPDNSRLLGRDDVIFTPHSGFYSEDALLDLQTTVATDVATVLSGGTPKYPISA
jgi:D-3-phosphoglycerate dehydrogenase